jgi:hypothetical protein
MEIADRDIGGARVRRRFTLGAGAVLAGASLTGDQVRALPIANRRAFVDSGFLEIWPVGGERHVVPRGGGKFDVIEGRKLNDAPLSLEDAKELAAAAA